MQPHEVTVDVADNGRGIAPEKLARAFEAFDRMDEEQLTQGSGLGLAVSKKFVDLHDGRMWIESEMGRGTAVSFALPLPVQARSSGCPLGNCTCHGPCASGAAAPGSGVAHRPAGAGAAAPPREQL